MKWFCPFKTHLCRVGRTIPASGFVLLFMAVFVIWFNFYNQLWNEEHGVVEHDVVSYYSYLPALIIEHDLTFQFVIDKPDIYGEFILRPTTPDGGSYQKMTMGLALLFLPFFLIGHVHALLTGAALTGFSTPYMFWLSFSSMVYAFMGLMLLRSILKRFFSDWLTAFALFVLVMGTNMFFYITLEPAMPHTYNFFLFNLFVWLTLKWHEKPQLSTTVYIGLTFGLIGLIRPTNGLIVIFFLLYNITSFGQLTDRLRFFLNQWKRLLLILLMAFLVVLPQFIFWKINTGSWIYYSYGDEGFFFNNPQILRGLFSYRKGWLVYTPIMIFALVGVFTLRKRVSAFFVPVIVFVVLNIYVIFSWWDWAYGGSFGARPLIDSYGLMAIALASLLDALMSRKRALALVLQGLLLLLVLLNIFQTLQYKNDVIHYAFMTKEAYWKGFGKLTVEEELFDAFESMDYAALKKGTYRTLPNLRTTIGPDAVNDFESLNDDKKNYLSPDLHYRFSSERCQSNIEVRNGNFSALLSGETAFTGGIEFSVKPGQKYHISVWKKPVNANAALVFAGLDINKLYFPKTKTDSIDAQGWGRISMEVKVPEDFDSKCKVYLWNKDQDTVFFDDFRIQKR